jgi:aldehyde dehydrogenase (NAD+)
MIVRDTLYIDGRWVRPHGQGSLEVTDSSTGKPWARVPEGNADDANAAVAAARRAFEGWAATAPAARAGVIERVAVELEARADALAQAIATEVGMPLKMAARVQVAGPLAAWSAYAKLAASFEFEKQVGHSLVVREPVGVVGAITPWNFPLNQITLKVAAAMAAGCTVVLKPSEVAPINAFILAEAIEAAGVPAGVFNLVTGLGPVVGEVIAGHADVDMVSFTGSTRAGRRVGELAAQGIRKVALELGGKSASVVLDDADLARAVKATVGNCYLNSGQTCSAHTRLLVPRAKHAEALAMAKEAAERFTVGPAMAEGSMLGPLVSAVQKERVLGYIRRGIDEGATMVTGGTEPPAVPADCEGGYYVRPTVFGVADSRATIAQEEIFGPVLVVIPHDGDDDAVRIANDTSYGLGGAVWAGSDERATAVARRIRTGQIDINGGVWNPAAPFGGFKQSGIGRENGVYGLEEFLEYKSLQYRPARPA